MARRTPQPCFLGLVNQSPLQSPIVYHLALFHGDILPATKSDAYHGPRQRIRRKVVRGERDRKVVCAILHHHWLFSLLNMRLRDFRVQPHSLQSEDQKR